ncbi:pimeloyl-ACP methyl ester carboxylesterase [Rhodoligotrophos appendicifer]|uniref:alpha/beta fold hydrolase n=1 Tax=Rhodoligotrophos appendicifer TaxID=987056 RepID=UPI00118652A4|nr:alpha/beta hydrolase [Rhodoligotrophos appendicifer]
MNEEGWQLLNYRGVGGTRLAARIYNSGRSRGLPVLCLTGLTRNGKDFHDLAIRLSTQCPVIVADYRGRGLSSSADWRTYTPQVEAADILLLLDKLQLTKIRVIGTSRGGIISMLLAAIRPDLIEQAVLNDIGPVIETRGLKRIVGYVGREPAPNWPDAIADLARANPDFADMSDKDWERFARRLYRDSGGRPILDYDPLLSRTLPETEDLIPEAASPLWGPFEILATRPLLVIRGDRSDILSAQTLASMKDVSPNVLSINIPGRGHAPFLDEPEALEGIEPFLL